MFPSFLTMSEKLLIISDIHEAHAFAERIIKHVNPDRVLFLGDYMDEWNDNPRLIGETAKWLRWSVHQPNRIHLWGNHDLPYAYPCEATLCPGWTKEKHAAVQANIGQNEWDKIKFYHWEKDWLFTHAGLTIRHLKPFHGDVAQQLKTGEEEAYMFLKYRNPHWFYFIGTTPGGILWCRPGTTNMEFMPIEGVNQMFGHTIWDKPWSMNWTGGQNWCIDTQLSHYAILEDGKMTIHEVPSNL